MIKLNDNYRSIYTRIEELESHFLDCKKPLDSEAYVKMYETLLMIYMGLDKEYSPNPRLYKNKFVHFSSVDKDNSIQKKSMEELINNKDRHSKLILDFIDDINEIINEYLILYNDELDSKGLSYISPKEQEEILEAYFNSEGMELKDLFVECQRNGSIYKMPDSFLNMIMSIGATIYNPLGNEKLVFLAETENKIGEISTIVHEFGHVLDLSTYSSTHSNSMTSLYFQTSPYIEVNSTYQEYKFYEYLLKNNIYKDDTKAFLADSVVSYLENLSALAPVGFIDSKLLRKHKGVLSRKEITDSVRQETGVSLDMSLCDNFIDIKSALEYSYGMMIAFSMLDDKTLYDKFQMIRAPYFDKGKLDSIGLDDDKISKVMVKKMTNYFKK
mgnify:FL=1